MTTFTRPPLPAADFVDKDGLWDQHHGPYTKEQMQARDAELLRAVAEWLLAKRRPYNWASENADRYRGQDEAWTLAAEELRKAAER